MTESYLASVCSESETNQFPGPVSCCLGLQQEHVAATPGSPQMRSTFQGGAPITLNQQKAVEVRQHLTQSARAPDARAGARKTPATAARFV